MKNFLKEEPLIIVEGKRDKIVMEKIGFNDILEISGKRLEDVVEEVVKRRPKTVVVMTDFDHEGRKKASSLYKNFEKKRIHVDKRMRKVVRRIGVVSIEELSHYL